MSGVKTVTMPTYERDRLVKQASQATSLSVTNAALARLNRELNATLENANAQVASMRGKLDSMDRAMAAQKKDADKKAEQLRQQLQQQMRDSNAALAAMGAKHQEELENMQTSFQTAIDATKTEVAAAMAANNRRIEQVIADNNEVLQQQIRDVGAAVTTVTETVDHIVASDDTLLAMARQYQSAAEALNADSQTYRCELLLPGQLQEVLAAQTQADGDIKDCDTMPTNAAVARRSARDAYAAALAFHERVIQAEQAWNLANQAANQAVSAARAQIEASRVVETTEGGRTVKTDVECWSNGGISALSDRGEKLDACLDGNNTLEELQQIHSAAQQLMEDTQDAVVFAMGAIISSQKRPDTAATLGRRIKEATGLNLISFGYDGSDQRAAHRMVLRNPHTKMEIIVIQTPQVQPDGTIVNHLEHHVVNYGGNNVADTDQQVAAVLALLGGDVRTVPGYDCCPSDLVTAAQTQQHLTQTATTVATVPGGTGSAAPATSAATH